MDPKATPHVAPASSRSSSKLEPGLARTFSWCAHFISSESNQIPRYLIAVLEFFLCAILWCNWWRIGSETAQPFTKWISYYFLWSKTEAWRKDLLSAAALLACVLGLRDRLILTMTYRHYPHVVSLLACCYVIGRIGTILDQVRTVDKVKKEWARLVSFVKCLLA